MEVREPNARYLAKPAFKQTEVGVIPEDWISPSIKEIAANRPNAIVGGPFGSDLVSKDYVASGVPVIRGQNMAQHYVSGDFVFVSKQKAKFLQANTARAKDIVFTQRGTLGQVSIVPGKPFNEYVVSQSQMKLTLNSEMADPEYVYQYFVSSSGQRQILDSAIQTGVPHTNLGILRSYRIPAPPTVVEQQAIAEALSDADALIESLEQLLAKKRQIKQGAMQELLTGQKRLPGFEQKTGYKQTDLGSVPEDWDVIPIGQAAQCLIGLTYSPNDVRSFGTLVLRSSNVQNGCLAFDDNVYVEMELPARVITQEDDILICVRNGSRQLIGKCALIDETAAGSAFGAFMAVLRSKSSRFLFQQFQSHILKRQISDVMGATINQITNKDMAAFKVIWPV
ncbi:MAG: putative type restriction enzyme, partial [Proteobacteria bacterium]|nr:putative type restriction enzyme [Pseudomonadota bacterium]